MRRLLFILWSLSMVSGCAYHSQSKEPVTPITYQSSVTRSADSIGKLRRLVVMPVELTSYKGKYTSSDEQQDAARNYQMECAKFLTEIKGYVTIVIVNRDEKFQIDALQLPLVETIQPFYAAWQDEQAGKHSAKLIQKIGRALNVDGVLVLRIKEKKQWGGTEGISNIALMNIPLFYHMSSPAIGAWIYETASGRQVWREEHAAFPGEAANVTSLFLNMENAVPRQLIE